MEVSGIGHVRYQQQYDEVSRADAMPVKLTDEKIDDRNILDADGKQNEDSPMNAREKQRRMERLQETLKNHNVEISYNDEVNRYAIKVLDADSKEVVKEIPSEKTLEMFARMLEIEGLLVDEKR